MQFTEGVRTNQNRYGLRVGDEALEMLRVFHESVERSNTILHLVAPCPPSEFATRHVLESLMLLKFLPRNANFVDIGPGAGLPSIPCLIVRPDLKATLVESKLRKSEFLSAVVAECGLSDRATVVNRQFEEIRAPESGFVTCRALDKFTEKLPRLVRWAGPRRLLLFGGPNLVEELKSLGIGARPVLMPGSDRRYLFVCERPGPRRQRIVSTK